MIACDWITKFLTFTGSKVEVTEFKNMASRKRKFAFNNNKSVNSKRQKIMDNNNHNNQTLAQFGFVKGTQNNIITKKQLLPSPSSNKEHTFRNNCNNI